MATTSETLKTTTTTRTIITHKHQRRWHSSTATTTQPPQRSRHFGVPNDGHRNVVISEARHSVCDMTLPAQVACGCMPNYNKNNNSNNNNHNYNNCNSSQRIASIANTISNNNTDAITTTTNTTNNNNNNKNNTSNSNNMNTLTAFSRNPSLASASAGAERLHAVDGPTDGEERRRLHGGTVDGTANKHKLPLRRNYKLTAIMPTSTSYYITLLLAAVILGTDLAGSETDALAKPLHDSAQALAIDMNTIEMPMAPPSTPPTRIILPTTPTTITPQTVTKAITIYSDTKVNQTPSSTIATTPTTKAIPSTTSSQMQIIENDNGNTLNATTTITTTYLSPPPTPPPPTSLASHDDRNSSQAHAEIAYSLSAEDSDTVDDNDTDYEDHVVIDSDGTVLLKSPSDSLTHGFSIPTYLPPFPEFDVADLPAYAAAASTTTSTTTTTEMPYDLSAFEFGEDGSMHSQDQMYMNALSRQQMRRNSTMPSINVTVQMGNHAYLPCNIRRFMNKPVSWVRVRDGHILSVDQTPFIADQRFQSIFKGENEYTWSLQIKYVQDNDAGWYECQVSTEPKMSAKVYLSVVVPITELIGDQNRFVKAGSKVALHCIVRGTLEPPTYIIWFRDKSQITDENKMGWYTQIDRTIFGNVSDNQNTIGSLIIPFVRKKDSGNYTCQPSNSQSVSVDLHVLSGEYSASAIMSGARQLQLNANYFIVILTLMALHET